MATIDNDSGTEVAEPVQPTAKVYQFNDAQAKPRKRRKVKNLAGDSSFGAGVWTMLHPGQVQAEYEALGQTPPSMMNVITGGATDAALGLPDALAEGVDNLGNAIDIGGAAALNIGKVLLIGVAVYALLELTGNRKLKRYKAED